MASRRMIVASAALALCAQSCAWNGTDRALFSGYLALSTVDGWQTWRASTTGHKELNPLFAKDDGSPDMNKVVLVKVFGSMAIGILLDGSGEDRRGLLVFANVLQGGVDAWNHHTLTAYPQGTGALEKAGGPGVDFDDGLPPLTRQK